MSIVQDGAAELRLHYLDNGLLVLLLEDHMAPVATFWVWYRVGSRNDAHGQTGISHWIEHMLFKGTSTHPKSTRIRYIERLGGRWNAFTWKDYTAYHQVLPAGYLAVAIEFEADRMVNALFDPAEVDKERRVIITEREGMENSPTYLLGEEVDAIAFKVHPYRFPIIGLKQDLRTITCDDLVNHYRTFYQPHNAITIAIGDLDAEATLGLIRRAFGTIPHGSTPPPSIHSPEPPQEGERRVILRRPGGGTSYLHIVYHATGASHPDLPALLVADGLLSGFKSVVPFERPIFGRTSRLYHALIESRLATEVTSSLIPSIDPNIFRVMATVAAGTRVELVEERLLEEIDRLTLESVVASELVRVKKQAKAHFVYARDGVNKRAMALGAFTVVDAPDALNVLQQCIERVTPDDITRVVTKYLRQENRSVGWSLPEDGAQA